MDGWPNSGQKGVIGLKFPPRSDLTTQKAQERSRQRIKKASTLITSFEKKPKTVTTLKIV